MDEETVIKKIKMRGYWKVIMRPFKYEKETTQETHFFTCQKPVKI